MDGAGRTTAWPDDCEEIRRILDFVCEISRARWGEVDTMTYNGAAGYRKRLHHPMPFADVCDQAQRRLAALHLDQVFEEFFRFRLGTDRRFWGFRRDGVFYPRRGSLIESKI